MLLTVLGVLVLGMLGVAVLPVRWVRQTLLSATTRLVQTSLLALLGACGTFFVQPEAAPAWAANTLSPILDGTREALPVLTGRAPGFPWLVSAILGVGVCLPFLVIVDLVTGLSKASQRVDSLEKQVETTTDRQDRLLMVLAAHSPGLGLSEGEHAAEALRTAGEPVRRSNVPLPRVRDLVK